MMKIVETMFFELIKNIPITDSTITSEILNTWPNSSKNFVKVMPTSFETCDKENDVQ